MFKNPVYGFVFLTLCTIPLILSCSVKKDEAIAPFSVFWEMDSDGFLRLTTNEKQYLDWAYWYYWDNGVNTTNNGTMIEAQVKMISGADEYGYGVVFGLTNNDFYQLLIASDDSYSYYCLIVRTNGVFPYLINWSITPNLNRGYNTLNTIKVSNNYSNGTYDIYLNGIYTGNTAATNLTGGKGVGFICEIGNASYENFPTVPKDCRFKLLYGTN